MPCHEDSMKPNLVTLNTFIDAYVKSKNAVGGTNFFVVVVLLKNSGGHLLLLLNDGVCDFSLLEFLTVALH